MSTKKETNFFPSSKIYYFQFREIYVYKKGDKFFPFLLFLVSGSGIWDPGWKKIRIRDKYPGIRNTAFIAAFLDRIFFVCQFCLLSYPNRYESKFTAILSVSLALTTGTEQNFATFYFDTVIRLLHGRLNSCALATIKENCTVSHLAFPALLLRRGVLPLCTCVHLLRPSSGSGSGWSLGSGRSTFRSRLIGWRLPGWSRKMGKSITHTSRTRSHCLKISWSVLGLNRGRDQFSNFFAALMIF